MKSANFHSSEDDVPLCENDVKEIKNSSTDQEDGSSSSTNDSTRKVTFAVTNNAKVHPKRRNSSDDSSSADVDRPTEPSFCQKCCFFIPHTDENIVASVGSNETENISSDPEEQKNEDKPNKEPPQCLPKCCKCVCVTECPGFATWTKCRRVVYNIVKHQAFEWLILLVILASTISLAFEDINLKNDPEREQILNILEYIFTAIFTAEMLLKWIGIGWFKYFTNWWCVIDFIIVVISWVSIGASALGEVESLKALRTLRALRPLRAISRWQGMRVVVNALVYCIPSIANVLCVCMLLWLVFSIIGVQLYKGKFYRCEDMEGEVLSPDIVPNRANCSQNSNYTWTTPRINFDNVLNGMIALFQVATFEGWIEVMADASDAVAVDEQPRREANPYSYIFFFVFVLFGSFFILNLIVGVIIESFQKLRKQTESASAIEAFLTESQKNFYKTMRTMLNRKPKKTIPPPDNLLQLKVFKIVTHSKFEVVVFSVIVLNMITLAMEHYNMSDDWTIVLRYVDITFTSIFVVEAVMKIIGTRFYYFRDAFNVFDFVVVMLSVIGFILEELLTFLVSPTLLRVVRVFRVFRVLRVIRAARGIRRLILTLMISLPALLNIAVLLGVFMVIFAILGMSFFMEVKLRGALNDIVNFRTFGNSMMLLFRLMTSAGWNDVLDPLMNDTQCDGSDCGKYHIAIIYFVIYIFLVFLVVVNMYIAIILENFDEIFQQEESGVGQDDFEFFYVVWGRYDPKASQFVSITELSNLLHSLHPPFQLAKPNEIKIAALNLPIVNGDKVHCLDVLFALVKRIMGEVEISDEMRQEAEARLLKSFPNRKSLKAETTTLALRQRVKAAKIIQEAWRGFNGKKRRFPDGSSNDISMITLSENAMENRASSTYDITEIDERIYKRETTAESLVTNTVAENQNSSSQPKILAEVIDETETRLQKADKSFQSQREKKVRKESKVKSSPTSSKTELVNQEIEKQASLDSVSSPEESSALIIKNNHVSKSEKRSSPSLSLSSLLSGDNGEQKVTQAVTKEKSLIPLQTFNTSGKKLIDKNTEPQKQDTVPKPEVNRTLSTPVTGKELKFNPRTGQFKKRTTKQNNDVKITVENIDTPPSGSVDQSVVIVNENSSG